MSTTTETPMIDNRATRACLSQRGQDTNLVWLAHPTTPGTWDLCSRQKQWVGKSEWPRHLIYGWVEDKAWRNGGYHAGGPQPYDEETDSDAWGEDGLADLETAMRRAEEQFNADFYI